VPERSRAAGASAGTVVDEYRPVGGQILFLQDQEKAALTSLGLDELTGIGLQLPHDTLGPFDPAIGLSASLQAPGEKEAQYDDGRASECRQLPNAGSNRGIGRAILRGHGGLRTTGAVSTAIAQP